MFCLCVWGGVGGGGRQDLKKICFACVWRREGDPDGDLERDGGVDLT